MATTTIGWGDGSGDNLYLTYPDASGDQTVSVTSDANTGAARSKTVTFTASGVSPVTLTVNQAAGLPYTPLEYIQTDGVAYIDSGVVGKGPRAFRLKVKLNDTLTNSEVIVGCGNTDGATSTFAAGSRGSSYPGKIGLGYYYFYNSSMADVPSSQPFEIRCVLRYGENYIAVKGLNDASFTKYTKTQNRNISTNRNMYIFASNNNNSPARKMANGERIYYVKIYSSIDTQTDTYYGLLFDGVPALYNGEYGLWDTVSNSFFGNVAGSGAFSGG